jgi:predicted CoA-binding protein
MTLIAEIKEFLAPKKMAIVGASRNPKKFGGVIFADLVKKGYELYPVHPAASDIQGIPCHASLAEVDRSVEMVYVVTPRKETLAIVKQAVECGAKMIWLQQGSDTPEAVELARSNNIPVIAGKCMFMYAEPVTGIHGFHRWLTKTFGVYPY